MSTELLTEALAKTIPLLVGIVFLRSVVGYMTRRAKNRALARTDRIPPTIPLLRNLALVCLYGVGLVMVLDNLGFAIAGFLAALGLGGAAIAFAGRDTIANLYGSIAIAMDRPFQVGDTIVVKGKVEGVVEDIGLRSTQVRTGPITRVSIPNGTLAGEIIEVEVEIDSGN